MQLKKTILKKYSNDAPILHLIEYDVFVYLGVISRYLLMLAGLFFGYRIINLWFHHWIISLILSLSWLTLYLMMMLALLNRYLDSILITPTWITVFNRKWILEYKTDILDWWRIDTVSYEQPTFLSSLLNRWTLTITMEPWLQYTFGSVWNPKKSVDILLKAKHHKAPEPEDEPESNNVNEDKFNILVETLWEVIIDYIKKDK